MCSYSVCLSRRWDCCWSRLQLLSKSNVLFTIEKWIHLDFLLQLRGDWLPPVTPPVCPLLRLCLAERGDTWPDLPRPRQFGTLPPCCKKNISVISRKNISFRKNISVIFRKNISVFSRKNISVIFRKHISVISRKNISVISRKNYFKQTWDTGAGEWLCWSRLLELLLLWALLCRLQHKIIFQMKKLSSQQSGKFTLRASS